MESFIRVRLWGFLAGGEMKHKSVQKRFMPPDKPISLINQCQWINYFPNVGFKTQNCNLRRKITRTSFCVPFRKCWQCLKRSNDKWQLKSDIKTFHNGIKSCHISKSETQNIKKIISLIILAALIKSCYISIIVIS